MCTASRKWRSSSKVRKETHSWKEFSLFHGKPSWVKTFFQLVMEPGLRARIGRLHMQWLESSHKKTTERGSNSSAQLASRHSCITSGSCRRHLSIEYFFAKLQPLPVPVLFKQIVKATKSGCDELFPLLNSCRTEIFFSTFRTYPT